MKQVNTASLKIGLKSDKEYFSAEGELLIAKNIIITSKHLQALQRRNIFDLYIREEETMDELERLLSREFLTTEDPYPDETRQMIKPQPMPKGLELPGLKDIKFGRDGLDALLHGSTVTELDRRIDTISHTDKPSGPPVSAKMVQIAVAERKGDYKEWVSGAYETALGKVRTLLTGLANADINDTAYVNSIVEGFMKTFVTDKNILLNIAGIKHTDGDYLFNHSLNVCLLSINIAAAAGYSEKQVMEIGIGAILHDVGMLLVSETIRHKDGRLTPDEWFEVQKHPILGLHLLERVNGLPESASIVAYQVHERENGKGYPRQRNGRFIHNYAKIIQCADVFEAVSSPRAYREAMAPYTGMEMLVKMARQGFVSGDVVKAFLTYTSLFPVGSIVELSDHSVGRVIAANGTSFTKPVISIITGPDGRTLGPQEIYQIDLRDNPDIQVARSHRFDFLSDTEIMKGF